MMFQIDVEERSIGRAYTIRSDKTTMFVNIMPSFVSTCGQLVGKGVATWRENLSRPTRTRRSRASVQIGRLQSNARSRSGGRSIAAWGKEMTSERWHVSPIDTGRQLGTDSPAKATFLGGYLPFVDPGGVSRVVGHLFFRGRIGGP